MKQTRFLQRFSPALLFLFLLGLVSAISGPADSPAAVPQPGPTVTPRQLYQQAVASYARFGSYIARYVQRDGPAGKEEVIAFYFRKDPWSVRFKWLSGEGQGREVDYVKGRYEDKLHIVLAAGDFPFMPAGHKMALRPDSPLVKRASKTPITQAGIGPMIDRFGQALDATGRDSSHNGRMTVLGLQKRPGYPTPVVMTEQVLPPGAEPAVPGGGRRLIGFHPDLHLPVLSILHDEVGQEVDFYRFDRLQLGVHLNDADFDPARMGPRHRKTPR